MNPGHAHLVLNHAPIIGSVIVVFLLFVALARKSDELTKVSLVVVALTAVAGVAAYLTGEPAEELVEDIAGVARGAIEPHEEFAQIGTIAYAALGLAALAALAVFRRRAVPRWFTVSALVGALAVSGMMSYTGWLGGQIRHANEMGIAAPDDTRTESESRR